MSVHAHPSNERLPDDAIVSLVSVSEEVILLPTWPSHLCSASSYPCTLRWRVDEGKLDSSHAPLFHCALTTPFSKS